MGRKSNKKKKMKSRESLETGMPAETPRKPKKQQDREKFKPASVKSMRWMAFLLMLTAFFLNINTFKNRFVLDDHGIIRNNKITKAPVSLENTKKIFTTSLRDGDFSGLENSLYRPMAKLFFNVEWNMFNGDQHKFHLANVIIYALLCGLMFWVLLQFFDNQWEIPFLTTLLFTIHPIHAEVVANIKSLDEILGLIGILGAMFFLYKYFHSEQKKMLFLLWAFLSFLFGLFSKESSITAVGIFPVYAYYISKGDDWKQVIRPSLILGVAGLIFILARHFTLGQYPPAIAKTSAMDNALVLCDGVVSQFATAVMILGHYLMKFLVPFPLSCDYSYATFEPVSAANPVFLITFALCLAGFIYAIKHFQRKDKIGFAILWFMIIFSLASNIFFLIGTSFGERLLFAPSLGLSLLLVLLLARFFHKGRVETIRQSLKTSPVLWGILMLVCIIYSAKTYARNLDWRSDFKLFSTDLEKYPNATHLLFYMGNHLSSDERKDVLTEELSALGYNAQQINDSAARESVKSIQYFYRSLSLFPTLPSDGFNQLGKSYFNMGQLDSAMKYYTKAHELDTTNPIFINNMGTTYYQRGIIQQDANTLLQAMPYFMKAHEKDTSETDFMNNIGSVYGMVQRFDSAIYWFGKSVQVDSLNARALEHLRLTYMNMGDTAQANMFNARIQMAQQARLQELFPN